MKAIYKIKRYNTPANKYTATIPKQKTSPNNNATRFLFLLSPKIRAFFVNALNISKVPKAPKSAINISNKRISIFLKKKKPTVTATKPAPVIVLFNIIIFYTLPKRLSLF